MGRKSAILILLCTAFAQPALALKCGHYLVQPGDYKADVYEICGEPDYYDSHYERRTVNGARADFTQYGFDGVHQFPSSSFNLGRSDYREIEVLVEELTYDFGRTKLRQLIRFENGRVTDITSIGRGRHRR